jgi:beta-mannanase
VASPAPLRRRLQVTALALTLVAALATGSAADAASDWELHPRENQDGTVTWETADTTESATVAPAWSQDATTSAGTCTVSAKLVPSCGVWWGMGANPLSGESYDQALVNVERTIGRTSDLARFYERGQSKMWPTAGQLARRDEVGKERMLYLNWRPSGLTWRQVANGQADAYLDKLAAHIGRVHPEPLMLSLHAEMETEVIPTAGSGQTAKDFRDFFRHVTQRLRSHGAPKIVTSVVYTGSPQWPANSWWKDLYPGDDVVDWIGQDPYAMGKKDNPIWRTDFKGLVNRHYPNSGWDGFYTWVQREHPTKPIVLAEFGVDEPLDDPTYKPRFLQLLPEQLAAYPNVKAIVYWNSNKVFVGTTRLDSSAATLQAARTMVDAPIINRPGQYHLGTR